MFNEVNDIAQHWPPAFRKLVCFLYHSEPYSECAFLLEECADTLPGQLDALEDAIICVDMLDRHEYDKVHEWSQ